MLEVRALANVYRMLVGLAAVAQRKPGTVFLTQLKLALSLKAGEEAGHRLAHWLSEEKKRRMLRKLDVSVNYYIMASKIGIQYGALKK